jgi:hypothetical protein
MGRPVTGEVTKMQNSELTRERRRARWSIACTVFGMAFVVAVYLRGPQWVGLVYSLGFMAGYIIERASLSRTLVSLFRQHPAPRPLADVS